MSRFLMLGEGHLDIPHNPKERQEMYEVFDSMDFDQSFVKCYRATLLVRSGTLSTGEWAAGLSVYFKGSMEEAPEQHLHLFAVGESFERR